MICPICNKAMIVLELIQVEIDYCQICEGLWLDSGELELLLENTDKRDEFLDSFDMTDKSGEKSIKCPICLKKMSKILAGEKKNLTLDKCIRNHGVWLNKGELESVYILAGSENQNRVRKFLSDVFSSRNRQ
ncbi:MAG: hypothetical protein GY839_18320 [candidate division Zixibacteria bacterium]|nr:hypothetical protein [candidate division Zixibacteria bacterium]